MIDLDLAPAPLARCARALAPPAIARPLGELGAADRDAARLAWAARIVDEYRSVAIFAELAWLLAELEAPLAAQCAVVQLQADELRHTRRCAEVAGWLGGHDDLALDLAELGLPPRGATSRGARALAIVGREVVVGEEESVVALTAVRATTTAPPIAAVVAELLRDEVRHAAVGRALLALFVDGALAATVTAAERAEVAATMVADRAELRARYRAAAVGGPGRALGASITVADLDAAARALGADDCAAAPR